MGKCSPREHFPVACLGITMALGIVAILGCSSVLMVGAGVWTGVEGVDQSFLVSNRFSEADPALGQGVPCLTGELEYLIVVEGCHLGIWLLYVAPQQTGQWLVCVVSLV